MAAITSRNLFIIESPLQAMAATDLALQLGHNYNILIIRYRQDRQSRNNEQIRQVIGFGQWSEVVELELPLQGPSYYVALFKFLWQAKKKYRNRIENLFFGEFHSEWMHIARLLIRPVQHVLIDDGTAVVTAKRNFLDKGVFYPTQLFLPRGLLKRLPKLFIYRLAAALRLPRTQVHLASAFFPEESVFKMDFGSLKTAFSTVPRALTEKKMVLFFGSKYSEMGIISQAYELEFLSFVRSYYQKLGKEILYCAHRDESSTKLERIRTELLIKTVEPAVPAELFILQNISCVAGVSGAYTSVLNNARYFSKDLDVQAFRLADRSVNPAFRTAVTECYNFFTEVGLQIVETEN